MFGVSKTLIVKKFQNKLGGLQKDFNIFPKDLRVCSIVYKNNDNLLNYCWGLMNLRL